MKRLKKGRARRAKEKRFRLAVKAMDRIYNDPRFCLTAVPYVLVSLDEYRTMQKPIPPAP